MARGGYPRGGGITAMGNSIGPTGTTIMASPPSQEAVQNQTGSTVTELLESVSVVVVTVFSVKPGRFVTSVLKGTTAVVPPPVTVAGSVVKGGKPTVDIHISQYKGSNLSFSLFGI
jgi:hypothetical protein